MTVTATDHATIVATAVAASLSVAISPDGVGVAISIAGANAFNSVHDSATARIDGGSINAGGGAVTVSASESSSIVGTAVSASVSVAVSVVSISVAGAESVVKNTIGNTVAGHRDQPGAVTGASLSVDRRRHCADRGDDGVAVGEHRGVAEPGAAIAIASACRWR